MDYQPHPIAKILPLLEKQELQQLADDIRVHGLKQPIVLHDGMILDGRNRYAACKLAGVTPQFVEFTESNPWRYVWSLNGARRHFENQVQKAGCWKNLNAGAEEFERIKAEVKRKADSARSEKTRQQHEVSNPRNGESMNYGPGTSCAGTIPESPTLPVTDSPRNHAAEESTRSRTVAAQSAGVNRGAIETFEFIERHDPVLAQKVIDGAVKPSSATQEIKRRQIVERLESVAAREIVAPTGQYDVIVIDPPWPMEKIERDLFPQQVAFDYPTMTESEMKSLSIPYADDCHVWLWTTHRFLPMAFRLLDAWRLKYVCEFVWHKPGGFQPFGLPQYNCELALYARIGSPRFIDTKAFPVCFNAPRGAHSEKPEEFYEMVRRVTAGRRLDMFNRRAIDGFVTWGKEAA